MMSLFPADDPQRVVWEACESPIEQMLCIALFWVLGCNAVSAPFRPTRLPELAAKAGSAPACFVFTQHEIGRYRADFLLVVVNPKTRTHRRVVIECDGRDYHSTEAQLEKDQQREDEIEEQGYRVFRYSGEAIHSRMPDVLAEIRRFLELCGVSCKQTLLGRMVLAFTPDRRVGEARRQMREAYDRERWRELRELTFEDDDGAHYRWADTL